MGDYETLDDAVAEYFQQHEHRHGEEEAVEDEADVHSTTRLVQFVKTSGAVGIPTTATHLQEESFQLIPEDDPAIPQLQQVGSACHPVHDTIADSFPNSAAGGAPQSLLSVDLPSAEGIRQSHRKGKPTAVGARSNALERPNPRHTPLSSALSTSRMIDEETIEEWLQGECWSLSHPLPPTDTVSAGGNKQILEYASLTSKICSGLGPLIPRHRRQNAAGTTAVDVECEADDDDESGAAMVMQLLRSIDKRNSDTVDKSSSGRRPVSLSDGERHVRLAIQSIAALHGFLCNGKRRTQSQDTQRTTRKRARGGNEAEAEDDQEEEDSASTDTEDSSADSEEEDEEEEAVVEGDSLGLFHRLLPQLLMSVQGAAVHYRDKKQELLRAGGGGGAGGSTATTASTSGTTPAAANVTTAKGEENSRSSGGDVSFTNLGSVPSPAAGKLSPQPTESSNDAPRTQQQQQVLLRRTSLNVVGDWVGTEPDSLHVDRLFKPLLWPPNRCSATVRRQQRKAVDKLREFLGASWLPDISLESFRLRRAGTIPVRGAMNNALSRREGRNPTRTLTPGTLLLPVSNHSTANGNGCDQQRSQNASPYPPPSSSAGYSPTSSFVQPLPVGLAGSGRGRGGGGILAGGSGRVAGSGNSCSAFEFDGSSQGGSAVPVVSRRNQHLLTQLENQRSEGLLREEEGAYLDTATIHSSVSPTMRSAPPLFPSAPLSDPGGGGQRALANAGNKRTSRRDEEQRNRTKREEQSRGPLRQYGAFLDPCSRQPLCSNSNSVSMMTQRPQQPEPRSAPTATAAVLQVQVKEKLPAWMLTKRKAHHHHHHHAGHHHRSHQQTNLSTATDQHNRRHTQQQPQHGCAAGGEGGGVVRSLLFDEVAPALSLTNPPPPSPRRPQLHDESGGGGIPPPVAVAGPTPTSTAGPILSEGTGASIKDRHPFDSTKRPPPPPSPSTRGRHRGPSERAAAGGSDTATVGLSLLSGAVFNSSPSLIHEGDPNAQQHQSSIGSSCLAGRTPTAAHRRPGIGAEGGGGALALPSPKMVPMRQTPHRRGSHGHHQQPFPAGATGTTAPQQQQHQQPASLALAPPSPIVNFDDIHFIPPSP